MCGIFGMMGDFKNEAIIQRLNDMAKILKHRGPDDDGFHIESNKGVGIGMTRLSIVDRLGGHQPIYNEDKSLVVALNGEIYNYRELREELLSKGHIFTTKTDTEVILHLYEEYGVDAVARLNGMFAFVIFNRKNNELFIARDRFGIKHLLYSFHRGFIFSSELKGFHAFPDFPMELDDQAVSDYFSLWYIPAPRCMVKSAKKLPQGHWMRVKSPSDIEIKSYWAPEYYERKRCSVSELKEEFFFHLKNSVRRQLQGEVPVGIFLSGGLDSGGIVAMLAQESKADFHTFSVGFDDRSYDETPLIMATVKKFNTTHHHLIVKGNDVIPLIEEVTYCQDQPLGMVSYPYYILAQEAKRYVTVVLSGEGGDEILGGYDTYCGYRYLNMYRKMPFPMRQAIKCLLFSLMPHTFLKRGLDIQLRKFIEASECDPEHAHVSWREIFTFLEKRNLLFLPKGVDLKPYHAFKPFIELETIPHPVNRFMYADLAVFLPEATLALADRIGMAHSLEVRVPYLDNEMFDFAASLPVDWKIRGLTPKYISRKFLRGILPDKVVSAPKLGFTPPIAHWFLGPLRDYLVELLSSRSLKQVGIFNASYIQGILKEHLAMKRNYSRHLMVLFNFMNWHKVFMSGCYNRITTCPR